MKEDFVLITGSSRGLGRELALVFAENGYGIVLHGRNISALNNVKEKISKIGAESVIVVGDIREDNVIEELVNVAEKKNISVLVNNAGSQISAFKLPVNMFDSHQIDELVNVHLTAPIKLTKGIYSLFKEKGSGTIININSLAGLESQDGRSIYCASKWGLRGFTNTLRLEAEKNNIFVMGIYPSRIKTRPELSAYGWETRKVAENIYEGFINKEKDLILDDRPEEFKKK